MTGTIRIVQYGLGPIGIETARTVVSKPNLVLAGAIDVAPDKVGKDLGDLLETGRPLDVAVGADAGQVLATARPDVVLFNGGLFASPVLRGRLLEVLGSWFGGENGPVGD